MRNFRELEVWKEAMEVVKKVYSITNTYPATEKFGLVSQMNRCAVSIASNIAEGCSRKSVIDFARFLEIAIGSCFELETQILIAKDLNFTSIEIADDLIIKLNTLQKRLNSLREKVLQFKN